MLMGTVKCRHGNRTAICITPCTVSECCSAVKDKILLAHMQHICEVHDTVMQFYCQQIHGSSGADATTSMENIGEQVYV